MTHFGKKTPTVGKTFGHLINQIGRGYLEVNVLTYNISWEAMEGKKIKDVDLAPICLQGSDNICLNNIAQFIIGFNSFLHFDLIGLQEASRWEKIYEEIRTNMPYMKPINHGLYREQQVIFFDANKYQLQPGVSIIRSYLADNGRPFMIIFLRTRNKENLCVINMHPGHKGDFNNFQRHLEQTFMGQKNGSGYSTDGNNFQNFPTTVHILTDIMTKLQNNLIIMMGDMNFKPPKRYPFLPQLAPNHRILHGASNSYTCCDSQLQGRVNKAYDHILASSNKINHVIHNINRASDHLPVIAQIQFDNC
jgi:endonuclease/exonuclease/phosphatase family metal-dependent hydrolase